MFRKTIFYLVVFVVSLSLAAQQKIRIQINSLPANTPAGSAIFIAGNFNSWNPGNKNFQFSQNASGSYFLDINFNTGSYEYKITRGSWDKVECNPDGTNIENHSLRVESDTTIAISIADWKDAFAAAPKKSTAGKTVHIIDAAFYMPQLQRERRIWIYLPPSYNRSEKEYPVLYMHDGQNVFEDSTSYAGEWGVDEALDTLGIKTKECIVVGIDNGSDKRLNEYCPYDFSLSGIAANYQSNKGEGGLYLDFLAKTLKPFIDKNYRTLKGRSSTFIAGSSMGGLISMYAVLKYPGVFGGAGVFSPAFWVAPKIFDDIKAKGKKIKGKIYFYAGKDESETMVPLTLKAIESMNRVSRSKMTTVIRSEGKHNEARWRQEFPLFYKWMMN